MTQAKSLFFRTLIAIAVLFAMLTSSVQMAQAKGGGSKYVVTPGQCNVPGAIGSAVVAKSGNYFQFAIQVTGQDSIGDWTISWTKNDTFVTTSTINIPPPGGWVNFGLSTAPTDSGIVRFKAVATSNSGVVCSATASVKI